MERMKVEIDSEELKRLKRREEKYLVYMDMLSYRGEDKTYVDALCGKVAQLEEENKKLKKECEENDYLVEDNARWMKRCEEKIMEIKKLKKDLAFERAMLDNVRAEYKSLQNVIKNLKEEREDLINFNENYSPDVIIKYVDRYETLYHEVDIECAKLRDENKKLKEELDKLRTDNIYEEGLYD